MYASEGNVPVALAGERETYMMHLMVFDGISLVFDISCYFTGR